MREKILNEHIDYLNIPCNLIESLKEDEILFIKQLCSKSKTYLKNLGFTTHEVSKIETELQLLGLNLKTIY